MAEKELGKITRAFLGYEDHGIFALALDFDFGSGVQGFGPIRLSNQTNEIIQGILKALNKSSFEEVVGTTAYALRNDRGMIVGVEGLPFEGGKRFVLNTA